VSQPALSAGDETSLQTELADAWRDAADASLRYWGAVGRLALESVTALVPLVTELRPGEAAPPAAATPARAAAPPTILVEAEAGQSATGVFLLENTTSQQLAIPVSVSSFHDPDGREVEVAVAFRPDTILLDPADQLVVQVTAAVDETLEPDVRYHAEISVPGLSATRIPIVVRRRASSARRTRGQAKPKTRAA
jgi:hypothetical protein